MIKVTKSILPKCTSKTQIWNQKCLEAHSSMLTWSQAKTRSWKRIRTLMLPSRLNRNKKTPSSKSHHRWCRFKKKQKMSYVWSKQEESKSRQQLSGCSSKSRMAARRKYVSTIIAKRTQTPKRNLLNSATIEKFFCIWRKCWSIAKTLRRWYVQSVFVSTPKTSIPSQISNLSNVMMICSNFAAGSWIKPKPMVLTQSPTQASTSPLWRSSIIESALIANRTKTTF